MSSVTSRATDSNAHGPRYAVRPTVLENTERCVKLVAGIRYGPGKIMPTAAPVATGHGIG